MADTPTHWWVDWQCRFAASPVLPKTSIWLCLSATTIRPNNSLMSKKCGTLAEMLKQNGWNTS
jgi:hypothetical protein